MYSPCMDPPVLRLTEVHIAARLSYICNSLHSTTSASGHAQTSHRILASSSKQLNFVTCYAETPLTAS